MLAGSETGGDNKSMSDAPPQSPASRSLDALYKRIILEHNRSPRNARLPDGYQASARGFDALCGDDIRVAVCLEGEKLQETGFEGEACAVTTASASLMTEWVRGRRIDQVLDGARRFRRVLDNPDQPDDPQLGELNQLRSVSAFPSRVRNALLPWKTLEAALAGKDEVNSVTKEPNP